MRRILTVIFWGIQVNLVLWLFVAAMTEFKNLPIIVGLAIGAILEHLAVRHLRPEIRAMSSDAA